MACFGIRYICQSVLCSQSRPIRVTRHFCIIKRSISAFFEKLVPKQLFFCTRSPINSLLLIDCFIKQYNGEEEEEQQQQQQHKPEEQQQQQQQKQKQE